MNHYPRHIGDWMRDTAHLSEVEECIYSRCLDQYYSREKPLPSDLQGVCRLVRANSREAKKAVSTVLGEFFTLEADGYHQKRCDAELAKYAEKSTKAAQSAAARWKQTDSERNANALPNAKRTQSEGNASQEPITNNQEKAKPTAPSDESLDAADPPIESMPLNTGEEFPIRRSHIAEWERLYPALDVPQTLREMRGWCLANPTRRKTKSGVLRFVNGWLAKEQNRAPGVN